jgi:predicted peptidase
MQSRFESLPSRLRKISKEVEIGGVPCLLSCVDETPRPFLLWMHGRTADKELDPGRYLRYVRKGINICAVDLPGHGARFDEPLQQAKEARTVMLKMASEIDDILDGLRVHGCFAMHRACIGGMSAGGMATIQCLLAPHSFKLAVLESTTGDLASMRDLPICEGLSPAELDRINPMNRLSTWSNIPVIAFHSRHDKWIPYDGQARFMQALQDKNDQPDSVEFVTFSKTGAPYEHIGFGRESAFVKEVQVDFVLKHLGNALENA